MTTPLIESVARAICRASGVNPDQPIHRNGNPESGVLYFKWRLYREEARAAIAACHLEEMTKALNRLTAAVGAMLNIYLADEEDDIELCHDTEHHLAILELRGAFDAGTKVERSLLGKPTEEVA